MKLNHTLFYPIGDRHRVARLFVAACVLAFVFLCGCTGKDGDRPLSAEELRLQRSCRIDTTTLREEILQHHPRNINRQNEE
jgi:hypothetical protein